MRDGQKWGGARKMEDEGRRMEYRKGRRMEYRRGGVSKRQADGVSKAGRWSIEKAGRWSIEGRPMEYRKGRPMEYRRQADGVLKPSLTRHCWILSRRLTQRRQGKRRWTLIQHDSAATRVA